MDLTRDRSLMVVEQIDLTQGSIYTLLKKLKPLLLDGFANRLSTFTGQTSSIGIYVSDVGFKTFTNYTAETFYIVVKSSDVFTVQADTVFPTIDDIYKMDFSHNETRKIFSNDPTINAICDIERNFWESTKTRTEAIKLLKQFAPDCKIKWYNMTGTIKRLCRKYMRRKIINTLVKDIKGEKLATEKKNESNTTIV
jgi:hypothetical protein